MFRKIIEIFSSSFLEFVFFRFITKKSRSFWKRIIDMYYRYVYRYVDDIVLSIQEWNIDMIVSNFNSFHPKLKFTVELGGNSLNFLK